MSNPRSKAGSKPSAEAIHEALTLARPPVAVSFADELPEHVKRFEGSVPAGCSFWQLAAEGAFATTADDHALCSIGIHTHNLAAAPASHGEELRTTLKVLSDLDYVRHEDVAAIPVLDRTTKHVIYAPLADAPVAADVVLIFAHSAQSLVIAEAVQQVEAGLPPAMGRPACAAIPQAANSGRAAMSLGCCGARAYLDCLSDDIALWALPGANIDTYAERIASLAKANGVLARFHALRREQVASGGQPTVAESLAAMK